MSFANPEVVFAVGVNASVSNEAESPSYLAKSWPMLSMVLAGVLFVGVGAWVAQQHDVLRRLTLEFSGMKGMATAEPLGANQYRLRMPLESSIYSRSYTGNLAGADVGSNAEFSIPVAYDPADPRHFTPSGQASVPAVISGLLFVLGMLCVFTARRAALAIERVQRLSRLKAEENRKRKKQRSKHKRHHHTASHRSAGQ